jgi:glutaredoxin 3
MAKVVMYSKDPCPYCVIAKRLLTNKGIAYKEIDLTNHPEEIQKLKDKTGWRTVPMIFINDKLIGGYDDLKALEQSGELDKLLES